MRVFFTILVLLTTNVAYGQDERPTRRPEGERPERIERPEPNRQLPPPPPPVVEQRREEPRPVEPQRPNGPPLVRPINPPIILDPWVRNRPCWDRWDCRPMIGLEFEFNNNRRPRMNRRPSRLEMAPLPLTEKQKRQLQALREEYRRKRQRILNNP